MEQQTEKGIQGIQGILGGRRLQPKRRPKMPRRTIEQQAAKDCPMCNQDIVHPPTECKAIEARYQRGLLALGVRKRRVLQALVSEGPRLSVEQYQDLMAPLYMPPHMKVLGWVMLQKTIEEKDRLDQLDQAKEELTNA